MVVATTKCKDRQEELLAKDKQLLNFQDRYDLIEAYEFGKLAMSQLDTEESTANVSKSEYKRNHEFNKTQRFREKNRIFTQREMYGLW